MRVATMELRDFKSLVEARREETGAWRGEIRQEKRKGCSANEGEAQSATTGVSGLFSVADHLWDDFCRVLDRRDWGRQGAP